MSERDIAEADEGEFYSQDYLQEDEDTCDVCKEVKKHNELKEVDVDDRGGTALVCSECIEKGWAEE